MTWEIDRRDGHVAVVTMDTNSANLQGPGFFADLQATVDRLERDHADCAVVLTADGSPFSAGLDLDYHLPLFDRGDPDEIGDWYDEYLASSLRLFTYPRPTVAAVTGPAIAGGCILALNCDYRIATDAAEFGLREVPIGVPMPAAYVELIRDAVGQEAASRMVLSGQTYGPTAARDVGIVHERADADALLDRAVEVAASIPPACHDAYAYSKRGLQARTLSAIEERAAPRDRAAFADAVSAEGSRQAQDDAYRELRGQEPDWDS